MKSAPASLFLATVLLFYILGSTGFSDTFLFDKMSKQKEKLLKYLGCSITDDWNNPDSENQTKCRKRLSRKLFTESHGSSLEWHNIRNNSFLFPCKNGQVLARWRFCNGRVDCRDGSDEIIDFCGSLKCDVRQFQCSYGGCIDEKQVCDKIYHCADGSDELIYCHLAGCPIPETTQTTSYYVEDCDIRCINKTHAEQNAVLKYDCINGSCRQHKDEEIRCRYGRWRPYVPCCISYPSETGKCTPSIVGSSTTKIESTTKKKSSTKPEKSTTPKKSEKSTTPKKPSEKKSTTPKKPEKSTTPKKPEKSTTPKKPEKSTTPKKPEKSTTPKKPEKSTTPKKPEKSTTPKKPQKSTTPKEPEKSTTPKKPKKSTTPKKKQTSEAATTQTFESTTTEITSTETVGEQGSASETTASGS